MFTTGFSNEIMSVFRTLARSWKSGSGGQGLQVDVFIKAFNKEVRGFCRLARSWKSGSGGQGTQIDDSSKGFNNKEILSFRRLARSWKSGWSPGHPN